MTADPILRIDDLQVRFRGAAVRSTTAVAGLSLRSLRERILGVVGETGCGKTVTGLSVLGSCRRRRRSRPPSCGSSAGTCSRPPPIDLRELRGAQVAMVFQNPAPSFNPLFTVGSQMRSVLAAHGRLKGTRPPSGSSRS